MTRKPAVAGTFYPKNPKELREIVGTLLKEAKFLELKGNLRALIVPHAGYQYSGPVAASGYKLLEKRRFKKVLLLGPSHQVGFYGASLAREDFGTPRGIVRCVENKKIVDGQVILDFPRAHATEHSLEVQLPFLQETLGDFEVYAFVLGKLDAEKFAEKILPLIEEDVLIVVSSDLSHYFPYAEAVSRDKSTITKILRLEKDELDACGELPLQVLISLARKLKWKPQLLDYRNSGDTAGDKKQVVGYAAIAFVEE